MDHVLRPLIEREGPLPFPRFMELALYHEDYGYYSDPTRTRVGRTGDFATSVSVGEAFGRLLALRLHQTWEAHGRPASLPVLEPGPEDGSLALDILRAARQQDADFHRALHYTVCEPNARNRETLAARFAASGEPNLGIVATPTDHRSERGVILANEVLDALPVHLVRFSSGEWNERLVTLENDRLAWTETPISTGPLRTHLENLPSGLPDGYSTEVGLQLLPFFHGLAGVFDDALLLFIDYGFERSDYYHPDRTEGTLQTYAL
ncbi:MAG: SAM-dependent methyltransferase, partial [Roseibacillus sp.]|nr:SAM-dependent methyltransferase [Roseibacillus sp.]